MTNIHWNISSRRSLFKNNFYWTAISSSKYKWIVEKKDKQDFLKLICWTYWIPGIFVCVYDIKYILYQCLIVLLFWKTIVDKYLKPKNNLCKGQILRKRSSKLLSIILPTFCLLWGGTHLQVDAMLPFSIRAFNLFFDGTFISL